MKIYISIDWKKLRDQQGKFFEQISYSEELRNLLPEPVSRKITNLIIIPQSERAYLEIDGEESVDHELISIWASLQTLGVPLLYGTTEPTFTTVDVYQQSSQGTFDLPSPFSYDAKTTKRPPTNKPLMLPEAGKPYFILEEVTASNIRLEAIEALIALEYERIVAEYNVKRSYVENGDEVQQRIKDNEKTIYEYIRSHARSFGIKEEPVLAYKIEDVFNSLKAYALRVASVNELVNKILFATRFKQIKTNFESIKCAHAPAPTIHPFAKELENEFRGVIVDIEISKTEKEKGFFSFLTNTKKENFYIRLLKSEAPTSIKCRIISHLKKTNSAILSNPDSINMNIISRGISTKDKETLIVNALVGIALYLASGREHLNPFQRLFDNNRGEDRARYYEKIFKNNDKKSQYFALYALLESKDGVTLKKYVLKQILGIDINDDGLEDAIKLCKSMVKEKINEEFAVEAESSTYKNITEAMFKHVTSKNRKSNNKGKERIEDNVANQTDQLEKQYQAFHKQQVRTIQASEFREEISLTLLAANYPDRNIVRKENTTPVSTPVIRV